MSDISVVVPCYNHSKYIERCLRSIFAQTLHPENLFVIDDGSTDNSAEVIKKTLEDCPFPNELISQKNSGTSAGINRGFRRSKTKYFAYLGADDVWLTEFLEERVKLLESRQKAVVAYGNAYIIDSEDYIFDNTTNWIDFPDGDIRSILFKGYTCPNPTLVYRSSAVAKFEWNEESSVEDYEMYLKLSTIGEFAFDKRNLSAYRVHDSNKSGDCPKQFNEIMAIFDRCREILDLTETELEKIKSEIKIECVDQFIRTNNRQLALSYLWNNASYAKSKSHIANLIFRLMIPSPIFNWKRKKVKRNAIEKYGKLKY